MRKPERQSEAAEPIDLTYRLLAANYLSEQMQRLRAQLAGSRGGDDIESIHQARVASRRLRAALKLFGRCFGGKEVKFWNKEIGAVTRGLGGARDRDVQIAFLRNKLDRSSDKEALPGIARLLLRLQQKREKIQSDVEFAIERLEASGALEQMRTKLNSSFIETDPALIAATSKASCELARGYLIKRIKAIGHLLVGLKEADKVEKHHELRIACKKCRYVLEITNPLFENRFVSDIKVVKKMQTLLGDIHDCDTWQEHLKDFGQHEERLTKKYFGFGSSFRRFEPGIRALIQDRKKQRRKLFKEVCALDRQLETQNYWQHLINRIECQVEQG